MSYFEDASLVFIPSAQKSGKAYSVKPTDGTGDLTFTRSNDTATRVNSAGLIEKVRTNFKIQSEELTIASGGLAFTDITTITANTTETLDPFGTNKAEKFDGTAGQLADTYNPILNNALNTSSIYAKAGTATSFDLRMSGAFGAAANAVFNLSNGTVTSSGGAQLLSSKIEFVGNGWYRCSISYNFTSIPTNRILLTATGSLYFFGWQLEASDFGPTPYIATTSAAVSVGPVANVPRLDYLNSSCPRLLLEPQRTNAVTFSEQFNNAAYTLGTNAAVTANTATSPSGYQDADTLANSGSSSVFLFQYVTSLTAQTVTASVFAKKNTNKYLGISLTGDNSASSRYQAIFNLETGAFAQAKNSTTPLTGQSYKIENYGNGWYRCSVTATFATSAKPYVVLQNSNILSTSFNPDTLDWSDATTGSVYIWGMQAEAGYATSYIPTLGSASTRGSDACSKMGISSLIGQTEGTLFVEASLTHSTASNEYLVQVRADNDNRIFIYREGSTNKLGCFARIGASTIYNAVTAAASTGTIKAAFAYKSGSFAFYLNGVQVGTSSATYSLAATLSQFDIDQNNGVENGYYTYAQSIVFPTRLSNSDLAALTA